jgi:hypothetical protein
VIRIGYYWNHKTGLWSWVEYATGRHGTRPTLDEAREQAQGKPTPPRRPDVQIETNRIERKP